MAAVTAEGVQTRTLSEWRDWFHDRFREAFGSDLALDPETPEGQLAGIMALAMAEGDEAVNDVANGQALGTSRGRQLQDIASLVHLRPEGATRSRVEATLTGVPGTSIPAGSRARTTDNAVFLLEETTSIPASGTVDADMVAQRTGPVAAPAGTLTSIVTLVAGWETVTNDADASLGAARETDAAFRARYRASTGRLAHGPADTVEAGLIEAGVTAYRVEENDGAAMGVVEGGTGHSNLAAFQSISDGSFRLAGTDFEDVDTSGATDLDGVAEIVQDAVRDVFPRSSVVYDTNHFVAYLRDPGDASAGFETHSGGTGTDISTDLDLDSASATITNDVLYLQGFTLPAHSLMCIVRGGTDADVAEVVRRHKGLGVTPWGGPSGDAGESVTQDGYTTVFRRATETAIKVSVDIVVLAGFPSDGVAKIKANLVAYAAGTFAGAAGQFETGGFGIGRDLDERRLQTPINAVPGHVISALSVTDSSDNALPAEPNLDVLYTLASDDVTVTVE